MKSVNFSLILALLIIYLAGVPAIAATQDSAVARVTVRVVGTLSVTPVDSDIHIGRVGQGQLQGGVSVQVDSNLNKIDLQVIATDLYKDGRPETSDKIKLIGNGAHIISEDSLEPERADIFVDWERPILFEGLTGRQSRIERLESSQPDRFRQRLDVHLTWNRDEPNVDPGQYCGFVKLLGMVLPE